MRYSDIKVGNIYFVNLDPVYRYEFGGNHLGIVLKKGKDQRTVTIISLTSNSSGVGKSKITIGVVPSLPSRLRQDKSGNPIDSYVVLDQVRTVVASRVQDVLDGKEADGNDRRINCSVDSSVFNDINRALSSSIISNVNSDEGIWTYHKDYFIDFSVKKMINLTYDIIKDQDKIDDKNKLKYLYNAIKAIKDDFSIEGYLNKNDVKNKVSETLLGIVGSSKVIQ